MPLNCDLTSYAQMVNSTTTGDRIMKFFLAQACFFPRPRRQFTIAPSLRVVDTPKVVQDLFPKKSASTIGADADKALLMSFDWT